MGVGRQKPGCLLLRTCTRTASIPVANCGPDGLHPRGSVCVYKSTVRLWQGKLDCEWNVILRKILTFSGSFAGVVGGEIVLL